MKKRSKHTPEQIVMKLRDADVMLNSGKDVAAVLKSLETRVALHICPVSSRKKTYPPRIASHYGTDQRTAPFSK
jgi:hypothetical protein